MQFHRALFREPSNYLQGRGQTLSRPMKLYGLPWRVATFLQPSSPHLWTSLLPNMQKEQKHHIQKKQLFFLTVPCASTLVRCSAGVSAESSLPPLVLGLKPTDTLPFSISVGCVIFDSLLFAAGVVFLHAAWSLHNFLSWPASNWAWPKQPSSNQRCAKSNQIMAATFLWCLQCHCSSFPSKLWLCLSRFFQQCQDLYENKCLRILLRLARSSTWRTSLTKARGKYKKDL